MYQTLRIALFGIVVAAFTGACGASSGDVFSGERGRENAVTKTNAPINQRFRTLDEYLAFLEKTQGPVDGPWYKEIRPGVYELQTGNLRVLGQKGAGRKIFTRDELERKFGFRN